MLKKWNFAAAVAWQEIDGEVIVIDVATGATIGLNGTGAFVWTRLPQMNQDDIATALAETYNCEAATAAADVADFLSALAARGLVAPVAA